MGLVHKTYQQRAYASAAGYDRLDFIMLNCARLYNAALEEWKAAYKHSRISRTLYDQMKELTGIRKDDPEFWGAISLRVGRGVLVRLDRARQSFFRRVRDGETPGFPRFKSSARWNTIEIAEPSRAMVKRVGDYHAIKVRGLPTIRLRRGLELPDAGNLKALTITRRGRRLFVNLTYAVEQESLPRSNAAVGIDMGVSDRLTLSTGEALRRRRKPNSKLRRSQQRLSRCRKGSRRWKQRRATLANHQYRERVRNRNECHRITTELVRRFGLIVLEDLTIKNMTASVKGTVEEPGTNVAQKAGLNRSITEQTWGIIRSQIAYKAAWAGRELVLVDPRFTSQRCSGCGAVSAEHRQSKRYECVECGMTEDADVNAALNILHKALTGGNLPVAVPDAA